jgi:ABC-2 type transport system ATP-binding protein
VIEVEGLRKTYGDLVAVDGITFRAEPGRIFGLLGPNGAGKTTTIGCICGLLQPSAGRVRVLGHDVVLEPRAARARMGVVPQELALYEELSAEENLRYWGAAYGLSGDALRRRVGAVLEVAALLDRARTPVRKLSGGLNRPRAAGRAARRGDGGRGPAEPCAAARHGARARPGRHVCALHHPLHGGGAEPVQFDRHR